MTALAVVALAALAVGGAWWGTRDIRKHIKENGLPEDMPPL